MAAKPSLRIHLLGTFRVTVDGRPVLPEAWRSRRASALVKLLALAPHARMLREQLADALWPDFDLDAQLNNLNVATSRARAALCSVGLGSGFLVREGDALVLGPADAVWIDAAAFEAQSAAALRASDPAACRSAAALYTGDLLPDDSYEAWAADRRTALRARYLAVLARLARQHEERGELRDAVEALLQAVAAEPTDEAAHAGLIRLYGRLGERTRAVAQFDRLATALRRHLDAEPAPETRALVEAIRDGHLPAEHRPALATEPVGALHPGALPLPPDELIGRERELDDLKAAIENTRLITLTGPGGIGKTRLALAVAHDLRSAFPDGVFFVDLSAIADPALVAPVTAQAIDASGATGRDSPAGLVALLANRRSLVVLDNFEQVVEAAPLVAALLERAPGIRLLVTSRIPLRVRGEAEYSVPPLPLPADELAADEAALRGSAATALFLRRARSSAPHLAASPENAAAIATICRRLDGLPLAIELAAARARVLSPKSMLTRLEQPLSLLVDGPRDLPGRQQTMRRTIAWSHDLLSPAEQRLLHRLSAFSGGWTLEAAEAVADGPPPLGIAVLDGLVSLVEKNLVVQRVGADGEPRFTLLETIREFALEQLERRGDDATFERHAAYFVILAERMIPLLEGDDLPATLTVLDHEGGNLRAALQRLREQGSVELALRLAAALRLYWFMRGRLAEGSDAYLAIAAMPEARAYPALRTDALIAAAFLAREGLDYDRAFAASTEGLAEAERLQDRKRAADALANLGYVALQRGDGEQATAHLEACLRLNRAIGNRQGIADALSFLGLAAQEAGDLATAWALNEESLSIWENLADRQATIWARTRRGTLLLRLGRIDEAMREFMGNVTVSEAFDFRWGISYGLDGLAHVALAHGRLDLARQLHETATLVRRASGHHLPAIEHRDVLLLRQRLGQPATEPEGPVQDRLPERVRAVIARARAELSPPG